MQIVLKLKFATFYLLSTIQSQTNNVMIVALVDMFLHHEEEEFEHEALE